MPISKMRMPNCTAPQNWARKRKEITGGIVSIGNKPSRRRSGSARNGADDTRFPEIQAGALWETIPLPPELPPIGSLRGEIHAWAGRADGRLELHPFLEALSGQERARAEAFRREEDRREYVYAHAAVRALLTRYLRCTPHEVSIARDDRGAPFCPSHPEVALSLTHSDGAFIVAFGTGIKLGVDVETVRPFSGAPRLVSQFFSRAEKRRFYGIEPAMQDATFFELWTRKEAYLKAVGLGLSGPLESFSVGFGPGETFTVTGGELGPWSLFDLRPFAGYVGALAVRGRVDRLRGGALEPSAITDALDRPALRGPTS